VEVGVGEHFGSTALESAGFMVRQNIAEGIRFNFSSDWQQLVCTRAVLPIRPEVVSWHSQHTMHLRQQS